MADEWELTENTWNPEPKESWLLFVEKSMEVLQLYTKELKYGRALKVVKKY